MPPLRGRGEPASAMAAPGRLLACLDGHSRLYRNGRDGRFVDITAAAGLALNDDNVRGAVLAHLNGDRLPDLYVCNDHWTPDRLWINAGNGTFRLAPPATLRHTSVAMWSPSPLPEVRPLPGTGGAVGSLALGDLEGDGRPPDARECLGPDPSVPARRGGGLQGRGGADSPARERPRILRRNRWVPPGNLHQRHVHGSARWHDRAVAREMVKPPNAQL